MTTQYTIYLVNHSVVSVDAILFLAPPPGLAQNSYVFANSGAVLTIPPNDPGTKSITIPVQYAVGAGTSREGIAVGSMVSSAVTQASDLSQSWLASYANVPSGMAPTLSLSGAAAPGTIEIKTNDMDPDNSGASDWSASMSFGIQTSAGFIGLTWSPDWLDRVTVTPELGLYISPCTLGGDRLFRSNWFAAWESVEEFGVPLPVPGSFLQNECTIVVAANGAWNVVPGKMMGERPGGGEPSPGGPAIMQVPTG